MSVDTCCILIQVLFFYKDFIYYPYLLYSIPVAQAGRRSRNATTRVHQRASPHQHSTWRLELEDERRESTQMKERTKPPLNFVRLNCMHTVVKNTYSPNRCITSQPQAIPQAKVYSTRTAERWSVRVGWRWRCACAPCLSSPHSSAIKWYRVHPRVW